MADRSGYIDHLQAMANRGEALKGEAFHQAVSSLRIVRDALDVSVRANHVLADACFRLRLGRALIFTLGAVVGWAVRAVI